MALLVGSASAAQPGPAATVPAIVTDGTLQPAPLPPELQGHWVVRTSVGEQPLMLEARNVADLVGRHVDIGSRLQLWDVFSGTIVGYATAKGTLREYMHFLTVPPPPDIPGDDRTFMFYQVGTSDCSSHGKRLSGCPVLTLARDPANGEVGLVTVPGGLALFGAPPTSSPH